MRVAELATGLWHWTGLHPDWTPAADRPDGWDQEVGCYFYEGPDAVVLFDPLVPPEDPDRFYEALDRDVERAGLPLRVLITVHEHRRSSAELAERYGGTVGEVPASVDVAVEVAFEGWAERVYWIREHAALVVGDLVLARNGSLEVPRTWVGDEHYDEVVASLRPLLDLPVERVLVTHGEPLLEDGREALAAALDGDG